MALKVYLGDGAYAQFDGFSFILTAENGVEVLSMVALEPQVLEAFEIFVKRIKNMTPEEIEQAIQEERPGN